MQTDDDMASEFGQACPPDKQLEQLHSSLEF